MASTPPPKSIGTDLLRKMDAWWRAANHLFVGETYLCDKPVLKRPQSRST